MVELTPHGAALGLAEALPAARLEHRVAGYGRGERTPPFTIQVTVGIVGGSSVTPRLVRSAWRRETTAQQQVAPEPWSPDAVPSSAARKVDPSPHR